MYHCGEANVSSWSESKSHKLETERVTSFALNVCSGEFKTLKPSTILVRQIGSNHLTIIKVFSTNE